MHPRTVPPIDPGSSFEPPAEFDDYVLIRALGAGRMGRVYLAEDTVLARPVAIKFIAGVPDVAARQRFLAEARATARVQHPNVVGIYRVAEIADHPYLVTELVRGRSLAEVPGPRSWPDALAVAIDLARGLAAAHRRGVVHGDLKPSNVMIADDGVAKLVDFGLARVAHDRNAITGGLVGTPDYMAPEVWTDRDPTRRSDVYSLGAMLFELCVGRSPHADVPARDLASVVTTRAAPSVRERAPAVDARLATIIDRCLALDPERRYPSADEVRDALEQLARQREGGAAPPGNPYRGLRPFEAGHRATFFGRSLEIGAIVERLRTESIVIVAGDSGVGKSSLCRAGVMPAIVDGRLGLGRDFTTLTMVPGARPLTSLATALEVPALVTDLAGDPDLLARTLRQRAGAGGLLLFIDQLEELITLGDPVEVAALAAGLARLSEGVAAVRVLASARADFLSRLAGLPRLGPELARLLHFVAPLPAERLREVIVGPAEAAGVRFASEAMIDELVAATAAAGSGGLPLLSFALATLWTERDVDHGVIGEAALAAVGGVGGALARHGDTVLNGLPAGGRTVARRVLARLVTTVGTRARRDASELAGDATGRAVLEALVRGRLLVIHDADGAPLYELAHEILVTGWPTLREWLELDGEGRARRERLAAAAAAWGRLGQRGDATWRGHQLADARMLDLAELTALEREFVRASLRVERRRRWALRAIAAVALGLTVAGYGGQRWLAQRHVDAAVAAEVRIATRARADADAAIAIEQRAAAEAFTAFDRGDGEAGEVAWQRARLARADAHRGLREAAGHLEAALARDPRRRDVRDRLGDTLFARATQAELVRDDELRDEMLARLPASDVDGHRMARWRQPGRLTVVTPPATTITIELGARTLTAGAGDIELPPGTYVVSATSADGGLVRAPVVVGRAAPARIELTPPRAAAIPAGFTYVPAGDVGYGAGGDEDVRRNFFDAVPLHPRPVAEFLIATHEVTIGDWLRFVDAQPPDQRAALVPRAEAKLGSSGALELRRLASGWQLTIQPAAIAYRAAWGAPLIYAGRHDHQRQDWSRFPVTAITATEAEAYTAWLDSSGAIPGARLCTEVEWERAARGVDGRSYPTGDQIALADGNFDASHGVDNMGPDEVGLHPASVRPFGVFELAGNAFEWTRAAAGAGYVVRGGSYFHDRRTAHLANRNETVAGLRDAVVGLRLCTSAHPLVAVRDDLLMTPAR